MKKIALFLGAAAFLASCTKWENRPTEEKVAGLWTGVNQEIQIQALPFLDSSDVMNTASFEANFMENGGLTIDSAGVRMDSMSWSIKNDTVLVLSGIDLGLGGGLPGGGTLPGTTLEFDILKLEETSFVYRYDTTASVALDPNFPAFDIEIKQIQRWAK
mgnify:FL=1